MLIAALFSLYLLLCESSSALLRSGLGRWLWPLPILKSPRQSVRKRRGVSGELTRAEFV